MLPPYLLRAAAIATLAFAAGGLFTGCASRLPGAVPAAQAPATEPPDDDPLAVPLPDDLAGTPPPAVASHGPDQWHAVALPGKPLTRYEVDTSEGRPCWRASADRSASLWRRRLDLPAAAVGMVSFGWWADNLLPDADVAVAGRTDAPARVMFSFDGDTARLGPATRAMQALAQALTGEAPPYATLVYVWDNRAPVGTVIHHPRTDRVRKIVVESGPAGLRRWRDHRRDLIEDFRRAFGEEPGRLTSVALMTDADNTASTARTCYADVMWQGSQAPAIGTVGPVGQR